MEARAIVRLFLNDGPHRVQLLPRRHVREFRDEGSARDYVRRLLRDPENTAATRRALAEDGDLPHAAQLDEDGLAEHLAGRLVREDLVAVSCSPALRLAGLPSSPAAAASSGSSTASTTPLEDELAAEAARPPDEPAEDHFIEIALSDEDGNPRAGERYFVELPDGTNWSGRLDGEGKARIEGIDPGDAKISFPDLDQSLYD